MKRSIYLLLALGLTSLACTTEIQENDCVDVEFDAPVFLHLEDMQGIPETKSASDLVISEEIRDFWLFEFNEKGQRIGVPQYYEGYTEGDNLHLSRPSKPGVEFKAYIIANTHNKYLYKQLGAIADHVSDLKMWGESIACEEDLLVEEEGGYGMRLSCENTIDVSTTILECTLRRTVAKLTVNISNNTSNLKILRCQLNNIPEHYNYWDCLFASEASYPLTSLSRFISYNADEMSLSGGDSWTRTFILPRNVRGENNSESVLDKNIAPRDNATYLEVLAESLLDGSLMRYKFYVGTDMTSNYDVIPDFHDVLNLDFNGVGNPEVDSRVEDLSVKQLEEANCYILNPMPTGDLQTVYNIPITRIDKFWASVDGQEYLFYEDNIIGDNSEWVAELIWQDSPERIMYFVDENGEKSDSFQGRGIHQGFNVCPCEGACGNALVGVYKKGKKPSIDGYLWSWHLWITEYNPEYHVPWSDNIYSYEVPGGQVHRHLAMSETDLWNTEYKDKYIMDRNLGAHDSRLDADKRELCGMLFQWGRKDPFIGNTSSSAENIRNLYDINGEKISFNDGDMDNPMRVSLDGSTWYYVSVQHPEVYFGSSNYQIRDWAGKDIGREYLNRPWRNPEWYTEGNPEKSFFDPCPPGWAVAKGGTWEIAKLGNYYADNTNHYNYKSHYSQSLNVSSLQLFLSQRLKGEYSTYVSQSTWSTNGGVSFYSTGYFWLREQRYSSNLVSTSSDLASKNNGGLVKLFPVRCVQL